MHVAGRHLDSVRNELEKPARDNACDGRQGNPSNPGVGMYWTREILKDPGEVQRPARKAAGWEKVLLVGWGSGGGGCVLPGCRLVMVGKQATSQIQGFQTFENSLSFGHFDPFFPGPAKLCQAVKTLLLLHPRERGPKPGRSWRGKNDGWLDLPRGWLLKKLPVNIEHCYLSPYFTPTIKREVQDFVGCGVHDPWIWLW